MSLSDERPLDQLKFLDALETARRAALSPQQEKLTSVSGSGELLCYNHRMLADLTRQAVRRLYEQAFAVYGSRALWNLRPVAKPTAAEALAITQALRTHGGMDGRRLAEQIEKLCRAAE